MEDEELLRLNNLCADLVGLKSWEAFPTHLLIGKRTGEWVRVRDVCQQAGVSAGDVKPDLHAVWLPDPTGNEDYVIILLYDEESLWSMTASYNRQRLLECAVPAMQRHAEPVRQPA